MRWKAIKNCDGHEVSNTGVVRRTRFLKPGGPSKFVVLSRNRVKRQVRVAVLVEEAYGSMRARREMWTPVSAFPGYDVSSRSRVRNVTLIHGSVNSDGYVCLRLYSKHTFRNVKMHQLVADSFLPDKPHSRAIPNHIDSIRHNNLAANLEWTSNAGNQQHAAKNGRLANMKLAVTHVRFIRRQLEQGISVAQIVRALMERFTVSVKPRHIRDIRNGKRWGWLK